MDFQDNFSEENYLILDDSPPAAADFKKKLENISRRACRAVASLDELFQVPDLEGAALAFVNLDFGGDGLGVVPAREIRKRCSLPIVFLTTHLDDVKISAAETVEPVGYLPRDADQAHLRAVL
ncbi:MAG: hypothetical protein V1816_19800 [Pseudomonadota bacterium]